MVHVQQRQTGDRPDRSVRGPATSIKAGATTRSMSFFSSCQASRRSATAVHLRTGQHRHRVGLECGDDARRLTEVADHRHSFDLGHRVLAGRQHVRQTGGDDLHAVVTLASELPDQVGDRRPVSDGQYSPHAGAAHPLTVQPPSQLMAGVRSSTVASGSARIT